MKSRPELAIEFLGGDLRIDAGDLVGSCLGHCATMRECPSLWRRALRSTSRLSRRAVVANTSVIQTSLAAVSEATQKVQFVAATLADGASARVTTN